MKNGKRCLTLLLALCLCFLAAFGTACDISKSGEFDSSKEITSEDSSLEESSSEMSSSEENSVEDGSSTEEPVQSDPTEGLEYSFANNQYTVTGYDGTNTDIVIPGTYNGYPVTSIGWYAFSGCSGLTSIMIPDSVTSIGWYAFNGCSCLTSVTIPDSVTSIGWYAFNGCSCLTSVTIPDSVTSIGNGAFDSCHSLQYNEKDNVMYLGNASNPYVVVMGVTDKTLSDYTIQNCTRIINHGAFMECKGLASVTIPDSVTSIGNLAFMECKSLTSVSIPDSVTSIGEEAFASCSGLTSIKIPDSVTSIGDHAFDDCYNLSSVSFENPNGWAVSEDINMVGSISLASADLSDPTTAAEYLKSTYYSYYWKRS